MNIKFCALFTIVLACLGCSQDSDSASTCNLDTDCPSHQVCRSQQCVVPIECSDDNPCKDPTKTCVAGTCTTKPTAEKKDNGETCTDHTECKSNFCSDDKKCGDKPAEETKKDNGETCTDNAECKSNFCNDDKKCGDKPAEETKKDNGETCTDNAECKSDFCNDDKKCDDKPAEETKKDNGEACTDNTECKSDFCNDDKKCDDKPVTDCVSDSQCGEGKACDNKKCVDENSCSMTRTCADNKICRDGVCIDKPHTTCDSATPCADTTQTCIAGNCVSCHCADDEICLVDGSCVPLNVSQLKNLKVGDTCVWDASWSFCDGNRFFSCSKTSSEETHTVKVRNCGANICADSPSDGINCYEPCPNEGDFYGECLQDYDSMTATKRSIAFKTQCTQTPSGLIWTFTPGIEKCQTSCANGSCVPVPDSYGTSCYQATFPDQCIGDWNLWCEASNNQAGIVSGEDCSFGYVHDKDKFYCAVGADQTIDCVTPCSNEGEEKFFCHDNGFGQISSDRRVCQKTADGKLGFFLADYTSCPKGCRAETGLCL